MRTLIIIAIGIFIGLALLLLLRKSAIAPRPALWVFLAGWLAFCAYNMWVGVSSAGYAVTEELPILAINFLVPAGVVFALRNRIGRVR